MASLKKWYDGITGANVKPLGLKLMEKMTPVKDAPCTVAQNNPNPNPNHTTLEEMARMQALAQAQHNAMLAQTQSPPTQGITMPPPKSWGPGAMEEEFSKRMNVKPKEPETLDEIIVEEARKCRENVL